MVRACFWKCSAGMAWGFAQPHTQAEKGNLAGKGWPLLGGGRGTWEGGRSSSSPSSCRASHPSTPSSALKPSSRFGTAGVLGSTRRSIPAVDHPQAISRRPLITRRPWMAGLNLYRQH